MSSSSEVLSVSSLIWSVPFDFRQWVCAISCMNCICCVVTVRSMTLARASTLTCSLLRQLFAAWRALLSWALISPSRGTVCCMRLLTSSRCCWVSWSFSAYARSERRSRESFLPVEVGVCDFFGIALLALPMIRGVPVAWLRGNSDGAMARCALTSSYPTTCDELKEKVKKLSPIDHKVKKLPLIDHPPCPSPITEWWLMVATPSQPWVPHGGWDYYMHVLFHWNCRGACLLTVGWVSTAWWIWGCHVLEQLHQHWVVTLCRQGLKDFLKEAFWIFD